MLTFSNSPNSLKVVNDTGTNTRLHWQMCELFLGDHGFSQTFCQIPSAVCEILQLTMTQSFKFTGSLLLVKLICLHFTDSVIEYWHCMYC